MNEAQQPDRRGTVTSGNSPEEIQQDIERTRAQLGETADALAHKLNPKEQAKEKVSHVRARGDAAATHARAVTRIKARRAQQAARDLYRRNPTVVFGVAAGVTVLVVAVVWRRNS